MDMSTTTAKLKGHAKHLVDEWLALKESYAMLHPTLFDQDVVERYGVGPTAEGFNIIRRVLFLSCAQDIAKLACDRHEKTPSIRKMMGALEGDALRGKLREEFATREVLSNEGPTDPVALFGSVDFETRKREPRRQRFDKAYSEAVSLWKQLSESYALKKFRTIRDKLSAHTEVTRDGVGFRRAVDIGKLGIGSADWQKTIGLIQDRCSAYVWRFAGGRHSVTSNHFDAVTRTAIAAATANMRPIIVNACRSIVLPSGPVVQRV